LLHTHSSTRYKDWSFTIAKQISFDDWTTFASDFVISDVNI